MLLEHLKKPPQTSMKTDDPYLKPGYKTILRTKGEFS